MSGAIPASRSTLEGDALSICPNRSDIAIFARHQPSLDATDAPVSGVQRPVKPACLNCKGRVPLMHTGLCESCDSVPIMREAWASEIALFIQAPGA